MISVLYLAQNMKFKVSTMYQTSKHIILHVFLNFPWIFFFFYPKRFASRGGPSRAVNLWMHFLIWCEIRIISVDMPRLCVNMPIFRIFPLFFFSSSSLPLSIAVDMSVLYVLYLYLRVCTFIVYASTKLFLLPWYDYSRGPTCTNHAP